MTVKISTLENGLRVVTDQILSVETATLGVWVDVGSRHESPEVNGISHVLEHVAFKGTEKRTALQIAEEIEAVGGFLNAYTSREITGYNARVLKEDIPLAVDILSDILQNSIFDETEFAREQSVILQEIGQTNDTPDDIVFDYFQETCFPNQPLGRPILGTADIVTSLTPDLVKKYMQDHYGAKQMVLAAAGNVDHDHFVDLAQKSFTKLPQDRSVDHPTADYQGGNFSQNKELEQVHVLLGFESVPYDHPDYYAASILSTILGGGMSSRLFQEIREKRGLVYTIYSFSSSYRDSGVFGVYAGTGPKQVAELLPVVCEELKRFSSTITPQEHDRAKAQLKAGLMMGLESTTARCEYLAQQMLIYGRPIPFTEMLEKINAVDQEEVSHLAQRLFSTKPALTTLGPVSEVKSYETVCGWLA